MKKLIRNTIAAAAGIGLYKIINNIYHIHQGNNEKFAPSQKYIHRDTILNNNRVAFLGSSITYGLAAHGDSFVDYLNQEYGLKTTKEAVSGTTLANKSSKSYIPRMKNNIYQDQLLDLFVCQLSTNDQRNHISMGKIVDSYDINDFNPKTTIGAIEYITAYVKRTWKCPVAFYTCLRKSEPEYEYLMDQLKQLQRKWGFSIIDINHDKHIKKLNYSYPEYMYDDAHPTRAGYRYAWTPAFVEALTNIFKQE